MRSEHIRREQQQLEKQKQITNVETGVKVDGESVDSLITITEAVTKTKAALLISTPVIFNSVNKNNDVAWTGDAQNDIDKAQISDNNIRALDDNKIINNREKRCTFRTFRLRSPAISKKDAKCSLHKSHRSEEGNQRKEVKTYSNILPIPDADNSRCCMKSISKHQRWRRKWNCCVGVPDSPDVPNDLITSLSIKHEHEMATNKYSNSNVTTMHFENAKSISCAAIKAEDPNRTGLSIIHPNSPVRDKAEQTRLRSTRAWPIARFRHIMRALHRYKRSTCRHQNFSSSTLGEQVKQNQICPLHLQVRSNGEHLYSDYYGASSPQSLFSTTNILDTGNERSNITDPSDLNTSSNSATFKTSILPTSIIRDETSVTYTTPVGTILPPVLPPPVRRKIRNPTDLDELTETLRFASNPSNNTNNHLTSFQRLPVVNNLYRRQRRKHFLRTRSPTLSPIHESGLSNPTSPQPYRHNVNSCSPSSSPIVMNKFCSVGSIEAVSSINIPDASVIVLDRISFNNNNTAAVISGDAWKFSRLISFQDNVIDVYHRKGRRLNGLQLPLHPLQLLGWIVLFLFGLATYWLLIPSFTTDLQEPLYGLIGGLYLVHVVSHLIALLIDPAEYIIL
uniref:Uncharacterized protein n=1 Tax=Glossina palpalis gambiensis TaxID=67801 RepID=A0A1B0BJJ6_9MUSC